MKYTILIPIIMAIIFGFLAGNYKFKNEQERSKFAVIATTLVSLIVAFVVFFAMGDSFTLVKFTDILNITFRIDGVSAVFALMVSFLWPLATVYATEYMKHEGMQAKFFAFYIMTFGVTVAIAFSANMLTLYLCYEALTFITLPLVLHSMDKRSKYAGWKYLIYSVAGASLAFVGMIIFASETGSLDFVYGGIGTASISTNMLIAYLLMFIGFGVKAAIFPVHRWLLSASVAPTTVTALLHAVAVVKSGVFAILRATFFLFGTTALSGTVVQTIVMWIAIFTICFGSLYALKSRHIKRRLAYSTISQLSYIVLGLTLMSTDGLTASLGHLVAHALMKIVLFYTAGSILYANHKEYVDDIEGYGKKMPITFACFTICSLALIGVPPFLGFFSKFELAKAAASQGTLVSFVAVCALMFSAILTAMYLLEIVIKAYFPSKSFNLNSLKNVKEAPRAITYPMVVITSMLVLLSLAAKPLFDILNVIATGGF